jgi:ABC-type phosphate transport system substrate-binding protein
MQAANEVGAPVILQASAGARKYAGEAFIKHLIQAAIEAYPHVPLVMHQDHGQTPAICQGAINLGFGSVMMDGSLREDGKWIDAGENDGATVQRLSKNPDALGVFGYSFLLQNEDKIRASKMDGVSPTFADIASRKYELARLLYFYVKKAHLPIASGLAEFVQAFTAEDAWGDEGYLIDKGLVPLTLDKRNAMALAARSMTVMTERPK